ncbi:MAG TPA: choice-of-anchor D domain-containing protein, partial [Myxococcaceae bacterium]|nr:choice-of-anchor D domain-containing protein [Myxococcaceae bacterium]
MKSLSAAALLAACVLILGCPGGGGCTGGGNPGKDDAGVTPASITLSDGPEHDFGSRPVGTSQDHTFTLTNAGAQKATQVLPQGIPGPFAFKGGGFPGTGGTCGAELEIGASCAVTVTFTPVTSGSFTSSLAFSFHDGNGTKSVTRTLKGSASTPAQVAISDGDTYDFGPRAVGASVDHTFTVTNTGGLAATSLAATGLEVPFAFKGGSYPGQGGTCGTSLASLSACTLVVTYAPTQMGNALRPLKLIFSDGANVQTVTHAVSGTAIVPAWLSFSDAPRFDYGTRAVGSSNEHAFTLVNSGGVTATGLGPAFGLAAPYAFKGGSYPGLGGTCGASLAANDRCVVVVTYAPTATGATTGTVGVVYTDGAGIRTASRELAGAATTQAALSLSDGPSYDFGVLVTGTSVDHTFQLSNSGPSAANMLAGAALS